MFTADQAAATLVALAKEHFPDSALAQACNFEEPQDHAMATAAIEVDTALRSRIGKDSRWNGAVSTQDAQPPPEATHI